MRAFYPFCIFVLLCFDASCRWFVVALYRCLFPLPASPYLTACGRGKKWKPAVDLLDTMRREGLTPDGVSHTMFLF